MVICVRLSCSYGIFSSIQCIQFYIDYVYVCIKEININIKSWSTLFSSKYIYLECVFVAVLCVSVYRSVINRTLLYTLGTNVKFIYVHWYKNWFIDIHYKPCLPNQRKLHLGRQLLPKQCNMVKCDNYKTQLRQQY